jgi:hypothetical protein
VLLLVGLCLLFPLTLVADPPYLGLAACSILVLALAAGAIYIENPLQKQNFPYGLLFGVCTAAGAYSMTSAPQPTSLSLVKTISVLGYLVLCYFLVWESRARLRGLLYRYRQGDQQRKSALQLDLEAEVLCQDLYRQKLEFLAAEDRYLDRMVKVQEAVCLEAFGVLALHLLFGLNNVGWLWWSFGLTFLLSTSAGLMIDRIHHDPNLD